MDFYFWNAVVTRMKSLNQSTTSIEKFKEEIENAVNLIKLKEIRKAINAFKRRLRRVEDADGGRIKKKY